MGLFTVFKILFGLYLASSFKAIPGAYFVRFYYYATKLIFLPPFTGKKTENIRKLQSRKLGAFSHSQIETYNSPFECDLYFHKNNCTYFADLDVSRCELMCSIFQKLMLESEKWPYIPVANVFNNFLKEIKPFERYSVTSNILCWDEKWIYVISKFKKNNGKVLCSLSLTKYVLKKGRKTIPPKEALEFCGLYNEEVSKISEENLKLLTEKCGFHETTPLEELYHLYAPL